MRAEYEFRIHSVRTNSARVNRERVNSMGYLGVGQCVQMVLVLRSVMDWHLEDKAADPPTPQPAPAPSAAAAGLHSASTVASWVGSNVQFKLTASGAFSINGLTAAAAKVSECWVRWWTES